MYIADWNSIQSNDWKIKRRRMRSATFSEDRPRMGSLKLDYDICMHYLLSIIAIR